MLQYIYIYLMSIHVYSPCRGVIIAGVFMPIIIIMIVRNFIFISSYHHCEETDIVCTENIKME